MPLFDNMDPLAVQQQINQEQQKQAMEQASMAPGRGMVYAAARAGQQLAGGMNNLMGNTDPRILKAQALHKAMTDTDMEAKKDGISLEKNPGAYYRLAIKNLQSNGLHDEAIQAASKLAGTVAGPGGSLFNQNLMTGQSNTLLGRDPLRVAGYKAAHGGEKGGPTYNSGLSIIKNLFGYSDQYGFKNQAMQGPMSRAIKIYNQKYGQLGYGTAAQVASEQVLRPYIWAQQFTKEAAASNQEPNPALAWAAQQLNSGVSTAKVKAALKKQKYDLNDPMFSFLQDQ